jgi:hypothetical protein
MNGLYDCSRIRKQYCRQLAPAEDSANQPEVAVLPLVAFVRLCEPAFSLYHEFFRVILKKTVSDNMEMSTGMRVNEIRSPEDGGRTSRMGSLSMGKIGLASFRAEGSCRFRFGFESTSSYGVSEGRILCTHRNAGEYRCSRLHGRFRRRAIRLTKYKEKLATRSSRVTSADVNSGDTHLICILASGILDHRKLFELVIAYIELNSSSVKKKKKKKRQEEEN